MYEDAKVNS